MKIKQLACAFLTLLTLANSAMAQNQSWPENLQSQRKKVMDRYIMDLQNADYKDIVQLFEKEGYVISTSKGNVNAKDFFFAFLPLIQNAKTEVHQGFYSDRDQNKYAVRFHFNFTLKDGETGDGEYVDEFSFTEGTSKLASVYMFENLNFIKQ